MLAKVASTLANPGYKEVFLVLVSTLPTPTKKNGGAEGVSGGRTLVEKFLSRLQHVTMIP